MKLFNKTRTSLAVLVVALGTALFGVGGSASAAACQWQYSDDGMTTSQTPVFNSICNVPFGVGNETDWVRVRQSTNGNDMDNQNNPDFVDTLNASCNVGDLYDVHYYIHNDAMPSFNDNGNGSAVAHDVQLAMSAPLGTTASSFTFGGKLTANNAASVSDTATVTCGGKQVQLTLVPSSVHLYSSQYGWKDLSGSSVNGSTLIGSPTFGSGDQWGCWDYRVVVVYQVKVQAAPTPQPELQCTFGDFVVNQDQRKVSATIQATAKNATVTGYKIDWGDHTSSNKQSDTHIYANDVEKATITASFTVKEQDQPVTGADCVRTVSFKKNTPPVTVLPNTGAGSVAALFGLATIAGAFAHRRWLGRRG